MTIRIILFIVFISCLVFSQSDQSVYTSGPLINNNKAVYLQNPSLDVEQLYVPNWHEFVTNTPSNMFGVVSNSFSSDNLPVLGYITALTTALVITDSRTHSAVKTFFKNNKQLSNYTKYGVDIGDGKINFAIGSLFALYGLTPEKKQSISVKSKCILKK